MSFITLEERIKKLNTEDRSTLKELRHREGDHPYNEISITKLIRLGLVYYIGGEPFLTETGVRVVTNLWV